MKTLKTIIPALALVLAFGTAKAYTNDNGKLTKNYAISTFVDAMTNGKVDGLEEVLDGNTKFCVLQGKNMVNYGKAEILDHMNANLKNIKQDCTTSTSLVEDNADVTVLKVDMQYPTFTRSNYVTIANTGNGWKITNVCSVFK